jgi:hypothetical protein
VTTTKAKAMVVEGVAEDEDSQVGDREIYEA